MKKLLVALLFVASSISAHAEQVFYVQGSPTGTVFPTTANPAMVSFVPTPSYTSYVIKTTTSISQDYSATYANPPRYGWYTAAPMLKDASGNIITTTWTHVRHTYGNPPGANINLDEYTSGSITGLTNGAAYSITFTGVAADPNNLPVPFFFQVTAQ